MITPSFGLTATERVLPKLALDFTTASLDSRVTFTRTTGASNPATYVNSSGVVTAATNNQPRFDYDPVTLACKGLLIEESRTNSCPYAEAFDDASWVKPRSSISADATTAPSGSVTADKLVEDSTASNTHYMYRDIPGLSTTTYTYSVYAKAAERTQVTIRADQGTPTFSIFNLSTGVVVTQAAGHTASIVNAGNGWYRCIVSLAITAGTGKLGQGIAVNGATSYSGNGTSGIYIWGAQLEAGAFATSYIPTTTTALTRNADVATMTGTNFSDWFNASEGTILISAQSFGGSSYGLYLFDGTTNNITGLLIRTNGTSGRAAVMITAGVSQLGALASLTAANKNTAVLSYKTNNGIAAMNGLEASADTTVTLPTVDRMNIAASNTSTNNCWIEKIMFWNIATTAAEVQAFSKG